MSPDPGNIDIENITKYWIDTSEEDYRTMLNLYKSQSYTWALFIGHISVEKLLKAYYVKLYRRQAPYIHNLLRLAESTKLDISDEYADILDQITAFNINARYEDYKREFYLRCTPAFTMEWIEKIKLIRKWIIQKL
jgi:HEPN domain-containing protein